MKRKFWNQFEPKLVYIFGVKTPEGEQKPGHQSGPGYTTEARRKNEQDFVFMVFIGKYF